LVALAALLVTCLGAGFIFLHLFNSAAKEREPEVPEVPVRVAVIGTNTYSITSLQVLRPVSELADKAV
jgi:hypothetical protein